MIEIQTVGQAAYNLLAAVAGKEGFNVEECAKNLNLALVERRDFVALGEGIWGRGINESAALDAFRREGGGKRYIVYSCPFGTYVDGAGRLTYPNSASIMGHQGPVEVLRRGIKNG